MTTQPDSLPVSVSVIVPSYNSRRTIPGTLRSLRRQATGVKFEVIVVDSSDDNTDVMIAGDFPEVRLIHLTDRTWQAKARNVGARLARGEWLAFLDADCEADPDWVETAAGMLSRPEVHGVGGRLRNANPDSAVSRAMFILQFRETIPFQTPGPVGNMPANNIAYRKEVLLALGGYAEDMGSSEEPLLHLAMKEKGWNLYFEPRMVAAHRNLEKLGAFLTHQLKQGRFYRLARLRARLPGSSMLNRLWATPAFPLVRFWRTWPLVRIEVSDWRRRWATAFPLLLGFVFYSLGEIQGHLQAGRQEQSHA